MRKLLFITCLFLLGCKTTDTVFRYYHTTNPSLILTQLEDSLQVDLHGYQNWPNLKTIGSDSVITTQYYKVLIKDKFTYVISLQEKQGDSVYVIKYRKE
jgi:hypothetical protein